MVWSRLANGERNDRLAKGIVVLRREQSSHEGFDRLAKGTIVSRRILSSKFVNDFLSCKKGDEVKGPGQIKQLLIKYGYLNPSINVDESEVIVHPMEEAIKKFQLFYNLDVSGVLDEKTLSLMSKPRCVCPDLVNGTMVKHGMKMVLDQSKGSYYVTDTKWSKLNLSWAIKLGTRGDAYKPIYWAIRRWALVTKFNFTNINDFTQSDLKIAFYKRSHGDSGPFDGRGGILAHAGMPPDGGIHFDADEKWVIGAHPTGVDIESVAVHELGHSLGLGHSTVKEAVMWPYLGYGEVKHNLNVDDIAGIKALYHF
ncbi:metalloendoproteinase 5-MMP-like [Impatiens glandulifera]|uniref:metalloendoproteinase 5-MMP-like n=1 Tax=Impatiens glandulifera TaxID=253017 RepID=UPI001FB0D51C|nr:metalloendoproteinase 5-MMP-like [Impatiens glandulifera]